MRFSLGTLMLLVLWSALGVTLWFCRSPWFLHNTKVVQQRGPYSRYVTSPYGLRVLLLTGRLMWSGGPLAIADAHRFKEEEASNEPRDALFEFDDWLEVYDLRFVDNDTVSFVSTKDGNEYLSLTYKRRFPEWWWGHFYRLEVWLFAVVTAALLFRGAIFLRVRRSRASIPNTVAGALNCVSRS